MSIESPPTEIKGSYLGTALQVAHELGFRPTDPKWESVQAEVARHEGLPLEDLPWYTQFAAIHHMSGEEAGRLAETLRSAGAIPALPLEVEAVVQLLIDLGQSGGTEFGYIGHHYFIGPEGSVTALVHSERR